MQLISNDHKRKSPEVAGLVIWETGPQVLDDQFIFLVTWYLTTNV
jgi:hypothetical protein